MLWPGPTLLRAEEQEAKQYRRLQCMLSLSVPDLFLDTLTQKLAASFMNVGIFSPRWWYQICLCLDYMPWTTELPSKVYLSEMWGVLSHAWSNTHNRKLIMLHNLLHLCCLQPLLKVKKILIYRMPINSSIFIYSYFVLVKGAFCLTEVELPCNLRQRHVEL